MILGKKCFIGYPKHLTAVELEAPLPYYIRINYQSGSTIQRPFHPSTLCSLFHRQPTGITTVVYGSCTAVQLRVTVAYRLVYLLYVIPCHKVRHKVCQDTKQLYYWVVAPTYCEEASENYVRLCLLLCATVSQTGNVPRRRGGQHPYHILPTVVQRYV